MPRHPSRQLLRQRLQLGQDVPVELLAGDVLRHRRTVVLRLDRRPLDLGQLVTPPASGGAAGPVLARVAASYGRFAVRRGSRACRPAALSEGLPSRPKDLLPSGCAGRGPALPGLDGFPELGRPDRRGRRGPAVAAPLGGRLRELSSAGTACSLLVNGRARG